ncbi:UPF0104 family protein [Paludibacter sp. 221]|uniref:lysylphosphatidylglycerol synthase transmembrane domain-containing protein n=1 Tax=Paludibacter sp. 221 TaxID=2302939 RepID=UPI0013D0BF4F|nr:lysylphosphatidylglycerol synthase transmembrane domain-containing protein [Paludibacter sp. 221]NDV47087.1 UPF0104 family protein [Paludibacter sp. 221]
MSKKNIYTIIKWVFVVAALAYLAYKLISFDQYDEFIVQWRQTPPTRFWWLAAVFLLLPLNWALEALKWKVIVANIEKISFKTAIKSVLAGITTGFFTPNRIGDLVGRVLFLESHNYKPGVTLSLLNSLTQNLTIIFCGIPACILFFSAHTNAFPNVWLYITLCVFLLIILAVFYFYLPRISVKSGNTRFGAKIKDFTDCLSGYSTISLLKVILISFVRYVVFSTQFYFMLSFFDVQLTPWQALLAIPTNYLFVTFTPSFAFSEAVIRASYAVFIIGFFSGQTVNIALAGVAIWFVNWVIPLLSGSVILLQSKYKPSKQAQQD